MENDPLEKDMEEALNLKLQEVVKEPVKPLGLQKFQQVNQVLDYDKLMDIGSRLLKQKMDEHMREISHYELQRIELIDRYRVQMERVKIEAEEQLHLLEQAHTVKLEALEKLIGKLKTLREA